MAGEDRFASALAEQARTCSDANALRQCMLAEVIDWLPFDSAMFLSPRLDEAPSSVNKEAFRQLYWNYARDPDRYRQGLAKGARARRRACAMPRARRSGECRMWLAHDHELRM